MSGYQNQIIWSERCGVLTKSIEYATIDDKITPIYNRLGAKKSISVLVKGFKDIFLPCGYPDSVSEDYLEYQKWDTLQAFCSTITGTITTKAVLESVGVGNVEATALAAAVTWILKDGASMIGKILFAWAQGKSLDSECKQWRLFADVLNDMAIVVEFLLPSFPLLASYTLCVTSSMKGLVGVAGGATRASITQHQAIKGNTADVSAKDGSQETCVNLIASMIGLFFLNYVDYNGSYIWLILGIFTTLHIIANYLAVKSLVFTHLNISRYLLVLKTYLRYDSVGQPKAVNEQEPLFIGKQTQAFDVCGFHVRIGVSIECVLEVITPSHLQELQDIYQGRNYILVPHLQHRTIYVLLQENEDVPDTIVAYFHAILLGIGLCYYNHISLNFSMKRQLKHVTPLQRLHNVMKAFPSNDGALATLSNKNLATFNEMVISEAASFFTALNINGWDLTKHSLPIDDWRYSAEFHKLKEE